MKVVQINSHYDQGGAARIVACIHRELVNAGQQSYVFYGRGAGDGEPGVRRFNHPREVLFSALMSRVTGQSGDRNRLATARLLRLLEEIRPDVVHLHALHGYYLHIPMLFEWLHRRDIPCVWTFHDCYAFTGNCGYFFDCDRWRTGCGSCPHLRSYPASWFFDRTAPMWKEKRRLFTAASAERQVIVTPSEWLARQVGHSFLNRYECQVIRNGIDTARFFYPRDRAACREKYGFAPGQKLALGIAVGYGDPRKGAAYILETARALAGDVKVLLIGWEKKNDAMLAGCANVCPLPAIYDKEVLAEYYSMADVFLLPSLAENYATTALEATACGTPVVGFAAGGTPEILADGRGLAVPVGDQAAYTEAVRKVLDGAAGLPVREQIAAKTARENSLRRMTEQYLSLYRRMADGG